MLNTIQAASSKNKNVTPKKSKSTCKFSYCLSFYYRSASSLATVGVKESDTIKQVCNLIVF